MELLIATRNKKKLREIKDIMPRIRVKLRSLAQYPDLPQVIENGKTFKDNAIKKAVVTARKTKKLTLGEDSGLCVDTLGGAPGVRSARFSGQDKDDFKNNLKLLRLLKGLPLKKRNAQYVCAVALADENGLLGFTEGKCRGLIGFEQRGRHGFGYDPLFIIPKYNRTFAELGEKVKHKMSHRYRALEKAQEILQKYIEKHSGN